MHNSLNSEINVFVSCLLLGIICGIVFDLFKAMRFSKIISISQLIIQDVLYYSIISVIIFLFILKVNGAQLRVYMPVSILLAFALYRLSVSRYVLRTFVCLKKLIKCIIKIALFPVISLCKVIILPFLKIKQKLLLKKAKIALTFREFCFKIKCNVGILCISNKNCKERKPCRRKQKPEKRA